MKLSVALVVFLALTSLQCERPARLAFWFEDNALDFSRRVTRVFDPPLTASERETVKQLARAEVQHAFAGLPVQLMDGREGFWRVAVVARIPARPLPLAGSALPLGPLGGMASVGADEVAMHAIRYAPPGAERADIVAAMGRGIGRVAVHEFAHQIIAGGSAHNDGDEFSYEYPSPARAAQYYGELRWTTWWPLLQERLQ